MFSTGLKFIIYKESYSFFGSSLKQKKFSVGFNILQCSFHLTALQYAINNIVSKCNE